MAAPVAHSCGCGGYARVLTRPSPGPPSRPRWRARGARRWSCPRGGRQGGGQRPARRLAAIGNAVLARLGEHMGGEGWSRQARGRTVARVLMLGSLLLSLLGGSGAAVSAAVPQGGAAAPGGGSPPRRGD